MPVKKTPDSRIFFIKPSLSVQETTMQQQSPCFLQGSGEMSELTRKYDWSKTPIGAMESWPVSLRVHLNMMLASRFPMLIFWGSDLLTFYNDAFRPSLGDNGKHPSSLGQRGEESWAESWPAIGPLIYKIMAGGESVWFEDQKLPIYREGKMDYAYWTYSFSNLTDDNGAVAGILVTCAETTKAVKSLKRIEESEARFRTMAENTDMLISVGDETGRATYFNKSWAEITGRPVEELLSFGWDDLVHPDDREQCIITYRDALKAKEACTAEFRLLNSKGHYRWIFAKANPRFINDNTFVGYTSSCIDITDRKLQQQAIEESQQQLLSSFNDTPVGLAILAGEDLVFTMANPFYGRLTGRLPEELIGKTLLEALPELEGQGFDDTLRTVLATGKPFAAKEALAYIIYNGRPAKIYIDHTYQPQRDAVGNITGVLVVVIDITDQVLSRKAIEESEARLELLSDAVPAMIFYLDREQRYQSYNKRFMQWFGVDAKEAIGRTVREFIGEKAYQGIVPYLYKAYAGRQVLYELEAPLRLEGPRWLSIVYTPDKNEDGLVIGIIAHVTDITRSKLTEIALRESEARFRSLIEEAPVATCLFTGRNLKIEVANNTMLAYWGKGASIIGMTLEEALPELRGQPFLDILDNVFVTGTTYTARGASAELEVDGVPCTYYFNFTYKPLSDADGKVYGIMNMAVDVTMEVLSKKALEESERTLRTFILQAPIAISILRGREYVVEIVNKHALEFWGQTSEQVTGRPLFDSLPELQRQGFREFLNSIYNSGVPLSLNGHPIELERNGKVDYFYFNFLYEALYSADGQVNGLMAVGVDVTLQTMARLKIEEVVAERTKELAQANLLLEQNNRELEQFAYIASHDLQEPLRKVSTFTHMLRDHLDHVDERSATYFTKITSATMRMTQLIRDVLNFSQLSNKQDIFEKVDIGSLIENLVADFELLIEQKGAVIHYRNLPALTANPLQMRQLFGNLISNALKFAKETEPPVITLSVQALSSEEKALHKDLLSEEAYCLITVADNGIGFDQQYAEKIFSIFQRLHGKTEFEGTGIGLALCKKIANNHNGKIWATAEKGKGAAFHIILPLYH